MAALPRTNRSAFRRAVFASVALHVALIAVGIVILRSRSDPSPAVPGIDTHADVVVRQFAVGDVHAVATEPPPESPPAPVAEPSRTKPVESGLMPRANQTPRTLTAEMLAVISRSVTTQPIATAAPAMPAIHGALNSGQSIVYVLDCSGSMGEYGKFALARAALKSTLFGQPEEVRFQVIVYNSIAQPLFPGTTGVPAIRANIDAAIARIAQHETKGRSNHVEAIRRAAVFRPDVILILTDADDLALTSFRSALAEAGKPIAVCVAKITASAVGPPRQLR